MKDKVAYALGTSIGLQLQQMGANELDITDFTPERIAQYVFESERERELVFVHKTVYDGTITPSEETDGGRFWSKENIKAQLGKGIFTPNFEKEIERVKLI